MKTKLSFKVLILMILSVFVLSFSIPVSATDMDGVTNNGNEQVTRGSGSNNDSISDYLKGYKPVTDKNMSQARQYTDSITSLLGTLTGIIVIVVSAGIFVITALDLCYIGLPFTRSFLNPSYSQGGGTSSMGGMGMGMGMGGMGMGGSQPQASGGKCWVSDEAIACVSMSGSQGGGGASPMGGMGMGMGMGGMGMSSMGGMGGSQQQQPTKSIITTYLKKRAFFLVIFAVATILLTSSVFTDCGINLAELSFKIMDKLNATIGSVNI